MIVILLKLTAVILGMVLLRYYIKGGRYRGKERADGKIFIVTGANAGIGKYIAKNLNLLGGKVYMLCRNMEKASSARLELIKGGCEASRLQIRKADMCDFQSIRDFAAEFNNDEERCDVLLCNAGVMGFTKFTETRDGYETTLQSNYLGHFLLSALLLPKLKKSSDPRIVNTSSLMHQFGDITSLKRATSSEEYTGRGIWQSFDMAYCRSKQAQIMSSGEFTRRSGVRVMNCHPGAVHSNILSNGRWYWLENYLSPLISLVLKSEDDGAQTSVHAALSKNVKGGLYYSDCAEKAMGTNCQDSELNKAFFEDSLKAVGIEALS